MTESSIFTQSTSDIISVISLIKMESDINNSEISLICPTKQHSSEENIPTPSSEFCMTSKVYHPAITPGNSIPAACFMDVQNVTQEATQYQTYPISCQGYNCNNFNSPPKVHTTQAVYYQQSGGTSKSISQSNTPSSTISM